MDLSVANREAAQDGRPLAEAQECRERPVDPGSPERTGVRGGVRMEEAERSGETLCHVPASPAGRGFLEADDVRAQRRKLLDHLLQPEIELSVVAAQLRERAAVVEIEGDEPKRAGRDIRCGGTAARKRGGEEEREQSDDEDRMPRLSIRRESQGAGPPEVRSPVRPFGAG